MWLLTLRDLQYRRLRVLVVVLLAAVVMALLFLMTGLVNQFNREPYDATQAIGADQWVLAEGTSGPFTSGGTLPAELVGELGDGARGVVVARGTISAAGDASGDEVVVVGGELGRPAVDDGRRRHRRGARRSAGRARSSSTRRPGFDVGDELQLGPQPVEVVGLTSGTTVLAGLPLVFVELPTAQDLSFQSRVTSSPACCSTRRRRRCRRAPSCARPTTSPPTRSGR